MGTASQFSLGKGENLRQRTSKVGDEKETIETGIRGINHTLQVRRAVGIPQPRQTSQVRQTVSPSEPRHNCIGTAGLIQAQTSQLGLTARFDRIVSLRENIYTTKV